MSAAPLSRRAALQSLVGVAAASLLGAKAASAGGSVSLEDLRGISGTKSSGKSALQSLDYGAELFESPDAVEKNILREKKPKKENKAIAQEVARGKKEEAEYNEMLSAEAAENARVRAMFKKLCANVDVGCGDYVEGK